jgi:serine/threonine protein phosphatase PrpC
MRLYCANVGDSRAVLCRGGAAVALSVDQTPGRPDERSRIEAAGGRVVKNRLYGVLGVSRSFGDLRFKAAMPTAAAAAAAAAADADLEAHEQEVCTRVRDVRDVDF